MHPRERKDLEVTRKAAGALLMSAFEESWNADTFALPDLITHFFHLENKKTT